MGVDQITKEITQSPEVLEAFPNSCKEASATIGDVMFGAKLFYQWFYLD